VRRLYHIVARSDWERVPAGPYRAPSLDTEGFIHCSNRDQIARVANLFYADHADLCVLCIDCALVSAPVRDEDPGTGELFPHVYGPIPREAIVEVRFLSRDANQQWVFP
jgi:uncharacterized protein (DUF952 family)